ncbi:hypothetical protein HPB51_010650 [Rhipicephalus microplus]|uniref:Repressor of the inhibitor of the protein kinase n=1 Tax=Rhipicephalus microplus TaxID=6941 RepID=A0A9J6ENC3_RHIMP|nr:hypothetical protein HPB51_010650 [Rhipicephalus microplus]
MSTTLSENFLAVRSRSQHDILTQLGHGLKKQAEENRKNLLPIIETIFFCGRQEVPLRDTDDSGPINMSEVLPFKNDGNFRALLRMKAKCGDAALRAHMETSPANALYTSPKIQNELITLCGKIIQRKIVENVNSSSCFSVLADEATDISRTAHISLCVKYVGHDTSGVPILKEDFVDFVPVYDLTGKALASTILNSLRGHGFDLNLLRGQGYDGAASMSGHLNGVQAFIRQTAPKALKRASEETEFIKIFLKSLSLLKITNVEMALPPITGRQRQRSNVPSATPEEYYRRNVYLPLLVDFENQLRDRFNAHNKVVVGLNTLLPKFCASASLSDIDDAVQFYLGDIPSANVIEAEFTLWVNKCCQIEEKNRPACALQALEMCSRDFFPNIHSLLSILATLPVSTSTPERTFSTLRRLKSYLRNHMNNDRLTGLALLSIHRELQVTPEQVFTEFRKLPRRKNFLK